jgi:hypothetical protein
MTQYYTSLKLSKLLKEAGVELESKESWKEVWMSKTISEYQRFLNFSLAKIKDRTKIYPSYHILEDICVRYPHIFFSTKNIKFLGKNEPAWKEVVWNILNMIWEGVKIDFIEDYIWENTVFNNKNKGKDESISSL